jgi:hypothetical protein
MLPVTDCATLQKQRDSRLSQSPHADRVSPNPISEIAFFAKMSMMGGCDTAVHAAEKPGRKAIGIEVTHRAVSPFEKWKAEGGGLPGIASCVAGRPRPRAANIRACKSSHLPKSFRASGPIFPWSMSLA